MFPKRQRLHPPRRSRVLSVISHSSPKTRWKNQTRDLHDHAGVVVRIILGSGLPSFSCSLSLTFCTACVSAPIKSQIQRHSSSRGDHLFFRANAMQCSRFARYATGSFRCFSRFMFSRTTVNDPNMHRPRAQRNLQHKSGNERSRRRRKQRG